MIKILIADDHAVVRKGIEQLLLEEMSETQFISASSFPETFETLRRERFDLLLLDVFMPGGECFTALREIRQNWPWLSILILSSVPEEQLALRLLRAGASGYLDKQAAAERLVEAVHKVLSGGRYISADLAEQLAAEAFRGAQPLHSTLSTREYQIMHLVVKGLTLKEIASDLNLSVKTVRTFHSRILEKLRLHSDVELVHYALNHSLIAIRADR